MDSYELSGDAMRTLGEIVRAYRSGRLGGQQAGGNGTRKRQENYRPAFYRLATNVGAGEYTARRQAWDEAGAAFADVADVDDIEYNQAIAAYDFRGRNNAVVGAAGTGQIVRGWKIFVDGDWVLLVDVGPESTFAVKVTEEGGSAGTSSTNCAFTYTVKNLAGTTMKKNAAGDAATGMVPLWPRFTSTIYVAPADNSYGLAFMDGTDLKLWQTLEKPDQYACV